MTRRLYSHYDTLRVDRGASPARVRTSYRRLAQKFHPDKHNGRKAAAIVMAEINLAYEVLSDARQRAAYDSWLDAEDGRGRGATATRVFTPDRFGWSGWLVFATSSLAVLTVGYVVLATWWPTPAPPAATTVAPAPAPSKQAAAPVVLVRQESMRGPAAGAAEASAGASR